MIYSVDTSNIMNERGLQVVGVDDDILDRWDLTSERSLY